MDIPPASNDRRHATRSPTDDGPPELTRLIALQRAAGNNAVKALVQRCGAGPCDCNDEQTDEAASNGASPSVQRAPAGPATAQPAKAGEQGLKSPRFAGDPVLEACFHDQARLGIGAISDSVIKVQQGLEDLGLNLGPGGSDGIYGEATAAAVRQFKTAHHLGFESFGDVGPGTMHKLDELLPTARVPSGNREPSADEESVDECPTNDDIVTALREKGVEEEPVGVTTTTSAVIGGPAAGTPTTPAGHVSMADAVRIFKSKVNVSNPRLGANITDKGQFFWGAEIESALSAELTALSGPGTTEFVEKARVVTELIRVEPVDKDGKAGIDAKLTELDGIAAKTKNASTQATMKALLKETVSSAGGTIAKFWTDLDARSDNSRPSVAAHATIRSFRKIRAFEKTGCFDHVGKVADRLRGKGGIKPVSSSAAKFADVVIGTHGFISDFRPIGFPRGLDKASLDAAVDPNSKFMMGQVFKQQGVPSAVDAMRKALDAGQLIHARVISGVGVGSTGSVNKKSKRVEGELPKVFEKDSAKHKKGDPRPITSFEEHSVLVIGYDGDLFVFNDPDASQSHSSVGGISEPGFGFLAFDNVNNRLGRGFSPAALPVDENGHTRQSEKRYQVISLHPA